ncbi:MAG: hypothetical protein OXF23_01165, partial [Candidatus Dadabacteria bacterium]|nr:hypothetical protein [Candidatus Dadabacteria bacterium]
MGEGERGVANSRIDPEIHYPARSGTAREGAVSWTARALGRGKGATGAQSWRMIGRVPVSKGDEHGENKIFLCYSSQG